MPEARAIFNNGCNSTTPRIVPVSRRSLYDHLDVLLDFLRDALHICSPHGTLRPLKACVRNSRGFRHDRRARWRGDHTNAQAHSPSYR